MVNLATRQLWVVGSSGDEGIAAVLDRDLNPVTTIRISEKGDLNTVVFDKVGNASWGRAGGFVIKHSRKAEGAGALQVVGKLAYAGGTSTRWG